MRNACSSDRKPTRSCRLRRSQSTDNAITMSNWRLSTEQSLIKSCKVCNFEQFSACWLTMLCEREYPSYEPRDEIAFAVAVLVTGGGL
jgi:hypothetical protein